MRRCLFAPIVAAFGVLLVAAPAWAHSEFDPDEAGTGKVIALQLSVANEQSDAGTTQVELFFPEGVPITLVDLPAVAGWTTAIDGGAIGAPVTSVTWSRPTASPDENPLLPLTVGPLPVNPMRLQFKALQTYSNGEVERWIDDWPAGAPEPDHPAPVLDVTVDGPGDAPAPGTSVETSTTTAAAGTTTTTTATTASTASTIAASETDDDSDDDDSNVGLIVGAIAAAVIVAGGIGYYLYRRSRHPDAGSDTPTPPEDATPGPGA